MFQKVFILGRVSQTPELRYAKSGTAVLKLNVCTNKSIKDQTGTWKEVPTFHSVTVFGKTGEALKNMIAVGSPVFLEGEISYSKSGEGKDAKYYTNIIANTVKLMGREKKEDTKPADQPTFDATMTDSDIPF